MRLLQSVFATSSSTIALTTTHEPGAIMKRYNKGCYICVYIIQYSVHNTKNAYLKIVLYDEGENLGFSLP